MFEKDLFSVIVLTYNQEDLVTECLQSVLEQTYTNIELIISDDASKDNTLKVVEHWAEKNRKRFRNIHIVTSTSNKGIPANHNRGLSVARGEFVKFIGGDDILLPNALTDVAHFFQKEPKASVCVTIVEPFGYLGAFKHVKTIPDKKWYFLFEKDAKFQFQALSSHCFIPGPCLFFKRDVFEKTGLFDENFRKFEDWPFLLKLTAQGIKLHFLPKTTVRWRIHPASTSNSALMKADVAFFQDQKLVYERYVKPHFHWLSLAQRYHVLIQTAYLESLIKKGGDLKAHRKARLIKLLDLFWWKNLPTYIHTKVFKVFRLS